MLTVAKITGREKSSLEEDFHGISSQSHDNPFFFLQTTNEFKKMVNLLIFTIKTQSPELAFHAAVSLGRLCVVEPVSKTYLISRLSGLAPKDKGEVSTLPFFVCLF